jgi:hypothetical protein
MTAWVDGFKGGYYTQSSNTWHNYANGVGQFNMDDAYFNQSVALTIANSASIANFGCTVTMASSGSGGAGPPWTARIKAILNSTSLVTNNTTANSALTHLTTNYVDISIPNSSDIALDLTAIAQEVVNESHWASGNKITFVVQGSTGYGGTFKVLPTWNADSFTLGGGGGGGAGGQSGANAAFFLMLMDEESN